MPPRFPQSAAWQPRRLLVWLSVLPVLGAIAASCTDAAGAWCSQVFAQGFHTVFGQQTAGFWILRFVAEKSVHVTLFTTLGAILFWALREVQRGAWWALVAGCTLGVGSELLQRLFPTRDPAVRDVLINGTAVGLGVLLSFWSEQRSGVNPASVPARAEIGDWPPHKVDLLALHAHMEYLAQKAEDWPARARETAQGEVGAQQNALVGKES